LTSVLLDTHVVYWWASEPDRISRKATALLAAADELAVAAITWYELAWLAAHGRIILAIPISAWLREINAGVRTIPITPAIAEAAAGLSPTFPGDPADRLIFATALELGIPLITKDGAMRKHRYPRNPTVW
jgi:PIN domain nuclease of toxin-antitoxin system